jgi:biopolymer transport protein ExbD
VRTEYSLNSRGRGGRPRRPIEIMMTPMIDVIFLLLVFFLTTSSFQVAELLLPSGVSNMSPPSGQANLNPPEPSDDQIEQIVVKIDMQQDLPRVSFNGSNIDLSELRPRFQAVFAVRPDVPVIIDPDSKVTAKNVVLVYDEARQIGLSRVYLATRNR